MTLSHPVPLGHLLTGASPLETDPKRQYRADQWAKFCGQHSCADLIEKCARAKGLLEKSPSNKWISGESFDKKIITRSNTGTLVSTQSAKNENNNNNSNGGSSGGIRSKLRKVFPFGLALKDKSTGNNIPKNKKRSETSDLVSYLSASALCASSGPALAKEQTAFIKNLIHHQDVPK